MQVESEDYPGRTSSTQGCWYQLQSGSGLLFNELTATIAATWLLYGPPDFNGVIPENESNEETSQPRSGLLSQLPSIRYERSIAIRFRFSDFAGPARDICELFNRFDGASLTNIE